MIIKVNDGKINFFQSVLSRKEKSLSLFQNAQVEAMERFPAGGQAVDVGSDNVHDAL